MMRKTIQMIVSFLNTEAKQCGIYAEECGASGPQSDLVWCIDPLDGTTNFAHGYPFYATSIGLTWNDKPILGAISIPCLSAYSTSDDLEFKSHSLHGLITLIFEL